MVKKLIKAKSKQTYVSKKDGKEHHYYNYYLELDNGTRIQIKPTFEKDLQVLSALCEYVG